MQPDTIDGVVARLDDILRTSVASGDRQGYFAAVYNRVTLRIRAGMAAGEFEDSARMGRLTAVFAARYFDAYDAWGSDGAPTAPWARTFAATRDGGLVVLQHLLLAMVTHITFDLGIAVEEVAPGPSLPSLRRDFLRINDLLAEQMSVVENQLIEIAGAWRPDAGRILSILEKDAHGIERSAADLLMDTARQYAWDMACRLADASSEEDRDAIVADYEARTGVLLDMVLLPSLQAIADKGSVAENIDILAQGEL
jgi:hypothetical protein